MIGKAGRALAFTAALTLNGYAAAAQDSAALTSRIELEKSIPATNGQPASKIHVAPDVAVPGDRVRVTLTFTNMGATPAPGVNLVNPIPEGLIFNDTADATGFGVSTDGGKTFGALAVLTIPIQGATVRPATAADVTHIRFWQDAIAPDESRSVAFFGHAR